VGFLGRSVIITQLIWTSLTVPDGQYAEVLIYGATLYLERGAKKNALCPLSLFPLRACSVIDIPTPESNDKKDRYNYSWIFILQLVV
jgi:hypothetical protein